jgi:hypothetical protein
MEGRNPAGSPCMGTLASFPKLTSLTDWVVTVSNTFVNIDKASPNPFGQRFHRHMIETFM